MFLANKNIYKNNWLFKNKYDIKILTLNKHLRMNIMIDANRQNHIIAVARFMKNNAEKVGLNSEEMFTLGFLHDIGYEFDPTFTHNKTGGILLKNQNYKYYNEVYFHGTPQMEFKSKELDFLNFADMHIDKTGKYVSFDERLEDIKTRRGENSDFYINSKTIINELKNNPLFKDFDM